MLRKRNNHVTKISPLCGEITEILSSHDHAKISIAMIQDIRHTQAHFHKNFEEIYFVIDGGITLGLYDPQQDRFSEVALQDHELLVIAPEIHHKIVAATNINRLCVICLPGFDENDEHLSDKF